MEMRLVVAERLVDLKLHNTDNTFDHMNLAVRVVTENGTVFCYYYNTHEHGEPHFTNLTKANGSVGLEIFQIGQKAPKLKDGYGMVFTCSDHGSKKNSDDNSKNCYYKVIYIL
jgi:hypothetical protein